MTEKNFMNRIGFLNIEILNMRFKNEDTSSLTEILTSLKQDLNSKQGLIVSFLELVLND